MMIRFLGRVTSFLSRLVAGVAAVFVIMALLAGGPVLLVMVGGNPLPRQVPSLDAAIEALTSPDDGRALLWLLTVIGWGAWAVLAGSVLLEIGAQVSGRRTPRVPGLDGPQRMANLLVAAVLAALTAPGISPAHAAYLDLSATQVAGAALHPDLRADPRSDLTLGAEVPVQPTIHTVRRGEALLDIAERYGLPVEALASANHHRPQPGGQVLRPGEVRVYPGWQLRVPAPVQAGGAPTGLPSQARSEALVHEVAKGDWMWYIAGRYLGDELRYPEIAALNPGYAARYPDYPDHIQPGDRLVLPPDAFDRGERPHATGLLVTGGDGGAAAAPATPEPEPAAPSQAPPPAAAPPLVPAAPASPPPVPPAAQPPRAPLPDAPAETDPDQTSPRLAPLLAGGVLASALLGAVMLRRARTLQHRRHGRTIVAAADAAAEADLRAAATADAARLDRALRVLAVSLRAPNGSRDRPPLPDVGAVWIAEGDIHLVLATPYGHPPPAPFQVAPTGSWVLPADARLPDASDSVPPMPALVTVGSRPHQHLLVDLERIGMLTITGHPGRCLDLLRYLVAELAHNPWSGLVEVTLAGFPPEQAQALASLNPDRIRVAASLPDAVAGLRRRIDRTTAALGTHGLRDSVQGRVSDTAADWAPELLIVHDAGDDRGLLDDLGGALTEAGRRCAVAVVTGTPPATAGNTSITVTEQGSLRAAFLSEVDEMPAAALPEHLLGELAALMRRAGSTTDHPVPPADEPWAAGTDATGHRSGATSHHPLVTAAAAAVLRDDTPALPVPTIGAPGEPTLDEAVTAWRDGGPPSVPRVEVLGPVRVTATGHPPAHRPRLCRELVVYLVARGAAGATAEEIARDLWPHQQVPPAVRTDVIAATRRWLAHGPDGEPWLPEAGGDGRYRLRDGLAVDWHLFRRLRARAERQGTAGLADLRAAMWLVRGAPLDGTDGGGHGARLPFRWLPASPVAPHLLRAGIVDAAHQLVDACLAVGDINTARWAVQRAWLADQRREDDHPWRDQMRIVHATAGPGQVREVLAELLRWRDLEHIDELAPATREVASRLLAV
jgi:nucleoid-associated protein YgaU